MISESIETNKPKCSILDSNALNQIFQKHNYNLKHLYKIWRYVVQKKCTNFDDIPNLPKSLYSILHDKFQIQTLKLLKSEEAKDRSTTKLLIELPSGKKIETVIIRYGQCELANFPKAELKKNSSTRLFRSAPRATVCISSQVGCAMQCRFCSTGTMGLQGNLTSGEILEQLLLANREDPIRNVVFMGMGEPLDNYSEVVAAIKLMIHPGVFGLSQSRICLSTVGVVPRMRQLQNDAPLISLALSLHAPSQKLREQIVPTAKALLEAASDFVSHQKSLNKTKFKNQMVLIEYVLISNVNASKEVALELAELLCAYKHIFQLNLIPYNPGVDEPDFQVRLNVLINLYRVPTQEEIDVFLEVIRNYDIKVTIRQTMGQDISSACGQLVVDCHKDIEDIVRESNKEADLKNIPVIEQSYSDKLRGFFK